MTNISINTFFCFFFSILFLQANENDNVCQIRQNLHQNFADILTNDDGIHVITELLQILSDICMDPKAHNAIISLLDEITINLTNRDVAESVGNLFYWTRKVMKNPDFRLSLHETMTGINKLFDRIDVLEPVVDAFFKNVNRLLNDPNFDNTFELFVENYRTMVNMHKNAFFKAGSMVVNPLGALRSFPAQPQRTLTKSASTKIQSEPHLTKINKLLYKIRRITIFRILFVDKINNFQTFFSMFLYTMYYTNIW